jgi:hypothetical protein
MNTTYPINYEDSTFFSSDQNIIATFPFPLTSVVAWAQQAPNRPLTSSDATNVVDLFDSNLSAVITNPGNESDFVNKFLPGNIYLNDNFGPFAASSAGVSASNSFVNTSITINGSVYNGTQVTSSTGSTSFLLGNPGNQRVIYQPVCTVNHLHFPKGCSVQQIINANEESYYKCLCEGTPTFDSNPHSHCSEFTNSETDPQTAINKSYYNKGGMNSGSTQTDMSSGGTATGSDGQTYSVKYANANNLTQTDILVRQAIYEYYCAVNKNLLYKSALEKNQKLANTANQALTDSTIKYKTQYLTMFNLISGIIIAGGYIYSLSKTRV